MGRTVYLNGDYVDEADARGFEVVWGTILADNTAMVRLARRPGFAIERDPDDFQLVTATRTRPAA